MCQTGAKRVELFPCKLQMWFINHVTQNQRGLWHDFIFLWHMRMLLPSVEISRLPYVCHWYIIIAYCGY